MNNWKEKLEIWTENNEANKSLSTEIVVEFMREVIYPLLIIVKENLSTQGKSVDISPTSPEEITIEQPSVYISIKRNNYNNCLNFRKTTDPNKNVPINDVLIDIRMDRTGTSPIYKVLTVEGNSIQNFESCINDFYEGNMQ